jgi:hypothetical protein
MGRGFTQYSSLDGDRPDECAVFSAFLYYVLDDGSRLPVSQTECYCPVCQRIDIAEHLETVADLELRLRQISVTGTKERKIAEFFRSVSDQLDELRKRIDWRSTRRSSAKCLHCGSTEISLLPDSREFIHPANGARMKVTCCGFMSTSEWHATYTAEGDLIESCEQ